MPILIDTDHLQVLTGRTTNGASANGDSAYYRPVTGVSLPSVVSSSRVENTSTNSNRSPSSNTVPIIGQCHLVLSGKVRASTITGTMPPYCVDWSELVHWFRFFAMVRHVQSILDLCTDSRFSGDLRAP